MIDLNCDLGEGLDNEHLLMPLISSCNIACGGHAGSIEIMDRVIKMALEHKVKIGVHPSFEDKENFGRVVLNISNEELKQSLIGQMELFKERAKRQEAKVHHVKPHGALYNLIAINQEKAEVVIESIQEVFEKVKIYVPYDRNYNDDLTLVSRKESNAILSDSNEIIEHVSRMSTQSKVKTISGNEKIIKADTFCVHGDNENVLEILGALQQLQNL